MYRVSVICAAFALLVSITSAMPAAWAGPGSPSSTGYLLRGTLTKQSGIARDGVITVRTTWSLPAIAPVFRYDFDILHGRVDRNLFSFMMGDIAVMEFLPVEKNGQPVRIRLKNGVVHKLILSSEDKAIVGPVNVRVTEVVLTTDDYGENIVPYGEVAKIEFHDPTPFEDETAQTLIKKIETALGIGVRDDLIDDDLIVVLDNLKSKLEVKVGKARAE